MITIDLATEKNDSWLAKTRKTRKEKGSEAEPQLRRTTEIGTEKSGHHGHAGRPGHVGGSAPSKGGPGVTTKKRGLPKRGIGRPAEMPADPDKFQPDQTANALITRGESWSIAQAREVRAEVVQELVKRTGFSVEHVREVVGQWEVASNGGILASLTLQEIIAEEFGVPLSKWQQQELADARSGANLEELKKWHDEWEIEQMRRPLLEGLPEGERKEVARRVIQEMYDYTQETFRKVGITEVTVVRGAKLPKEQESLSVGSEVTLKQNTASSWTTDMVTAQYYGVAVVGMTVPIDRVLGFARTGFGQLSEFEFVLLGSDRDVARIVWRHTPAPRSQEGRRELVVIVDLANEENDDWLKKVRRGRSTEIGTEKSGHHGHAGRPGEVGGSAPSKGKAAAKKKQPTLGDLVEPERGVGKPVESGPLGYGLTEIPFDSLEAEKFISRGKDVTDISLRGDAKAIVVAEITERTGVSERDVQAVVDQWAHTSNDDDLRALSLQEAISEEFGVPLSEWQQQKLDRLRELGVEWDEVVDTADEQASIEGYDDVDEYLVDMIYQFQDEHEVDPEIGQLDEILGRLRPDDYKEATKKVVRAMYDYTQDELRKTGITEVKLVRGLFSLDMHDEDVKLGDVVKIAQNAASSWTSDVGVAQDFGDWVLGMTVPAERILTTSRTGLGCLREFEFTVLGGTGDTARVVVEAYKEKKW